jgi:hypothetical protein
MHNMQRLRMRAQDIDYVIHYSKKINLKGS